MNHERTLALIKPDAPGIDVDGSIIYRIPLIVKMYMDSGLTIEQWIAFHFTRELAREFYQEHQHRPWFRELTNFMASSPCHALVLRGENAMERVRNTNGATDPRQADPASIRGVFRGYFDPSLKAANFVHGSDSLDSARREVRLIFGDV
jgi:nucleoside-diphosphate kinase